MFFKKKREMFNIINNISCRRQDSSQDSIATQLCLFRLNIGSMCHIFIGVVSQIITKQFYFFFTKCHEQYPVFTIEVTARPQDVQLDRWPHLSPVEVSSASVLHCKSGISNIFLLLFFRKRCKNFKNNSEHRQKNG